MTKPYELSVLQDAKPDDVCYKTDLLCPALRTFCRYLKQSTGSCIRSRTSIFKLQHCDVTYVAHLTCDATYLVRICCKQSTLLIVSKENIHVSEFSVQADNIYFDASHWISCNNTMTASHVIHWDQQGSTNREISGKLWAMYFLVQRYYQWEKHFCSRLCNVRCHKTSCWVLGPELCQYIFSSMLLHSLSKPRKSRRQRHPWLKPQTDGGNEDENHSSIDIFRGVNNDRSWPQNEWGIMTYARCAAAHMMLLPSFKHTRTEMFTCQRATKTDCQEYQRN